jgi:superfamily II DNA helicase RecQ
MANVWGVLSPREFQVEAVAWLVFEAKTCLFLIQKTGKGKPAVVLTASTLLQGITLLVVPLLGLGCDQVARVQHHCHKVEAFHLDKNRGEDQLAIQQCLLGQLLNTKQDIGVSPTAGSMQIHRGRNHLVQISQLRL